MKIDIAGRDFIYKEEGVRLKAYLDSVSIPTIGVGFTFYPDGKKVKMGDVITLKQCDEMFAKIVAGFEKAVNDSIKIALTQNQFNALVSLAFNIGTTGFAKSTLVKRISKGDSEESIRAAFNMWVKGGGKILPGLVKRRKRESDLYFKS